MAKKRKTKKTHVKAAQDNDPKTIILSKSNSKSLQQLSRDLRNQFEPNTASRLKERKTNKIKDFIMIAPVLKVSHLLIFTQKTLRIIKLKGITVTFNIKEYSLCKDLIALNARVQNDFNNPLVVLNNFPKTQEYSLLNLFITSMYPAIKVSKIKLKDCKRVVLFDFKDGVIQWRHYSITVKTKVNKSIKQLIAKKIPDLSKLNSVEDFITFESDYSDYEELEEKRGVKLVEIGPRVDMEMIKIQDGMMSGKVLYHKYIQKTAEEVEEIERRVAEQNLLREKRRKEQEKNVEKKKREKEAISEKSREANRIHLAKMRGDEVPEGEEAQDIPEEGEQNEVVQELSDEDEEMEYDEDDFDDLMDQDFDQAE